MGKRLNLEEKEIAKVRLARGDSLRSVARALKKSPATIKKLADDPKSREDILAIRETLAGKYEDIADRLVTDIPNGDITKMGVYQRVLSSSIATDKANLLRGMGVLNTGVQVNIIVHDARSVKAIDVTEDSGKEDD